MAGETILNTIYKKNKSWKICDCWQNEYTLSRLPEPIQNQIYLSIQSQIGNTSYGQTDFFKLQIINNTVESQAD